MTKILMTVLVMMTATIAIGSRAARDSSARLVREDALGGRVQLVGAYMPAMADARVLMSRRCDGGYEYQELGQIVEYRCEARASVGGAELALGTR